MDRVLPQSLDTQKELAIRDFINQKFESEGLKHDFPNPLLREDVLELLDRYCTVVYYPLEDENNNGFRLKEIPFLNGEKRDFVFINTAQTGEKQAFTAAHELGHIWAVDEYIIQKYSLLGTEAEREIIINRFAAVLLMPSELFRVTVKKRAEEYLKEDRRTIALIDLLKVVVHLMNHFYAPRKAVVLRMRELNQIDDQTAERLLDETSDFGENIKKFTEEYIAECGYVNLQNASHKKWIEGLVEVLDFADKNNAVPKNKIDRLRTAFDLKKAAEASPDMDGRVSLDTQEG